LHHRFLPSDSGERGAFTPNGASRVLLVGDFFREDLRQIVFSDRTTS
jgi:hypothetical protein